MACYSTILSQNQGRPIYLWLIPLYPCLLNKPFYCCYLKHNPVAGQHCWVLPWQCPLQKWHVVAVSARSQCWWDNCWDLSVVNISVGWESVRGRGGKQGKSRKGVKLGRWRVVWSISGPGWNWACQQNLPQNPIPSWASEPYMGLLKQLNSTDQSRLIESAGAQHGVRKLCSHTLRSLAVSLSSGVQWQPFQHHCTRRQKPLQDWTACLWFPAVLTALQDSPRTLATFSADANPLASVLVLSPSHW